VLKKGQVNNENIKTLKVLETSYRLTVFRSGATPSIYRCDFSCDSRGRFIIGIVLIFPITIWFYRQYRSDKRLNHTILIYLFSAILCGILIGGLGQVLYDHTSLEYGHVKIAIWAFTTIVQTFLKVILSYSLVSIYKALPIKSRVDQLRLPVLVSMLIVAFCLAIAVWFPILGSFVLSIGDALILIFTLYYFIYFTKENADEKTA